MRSRAPRVQYLALAGLSRPVALSECDPLLPLFAEVLATWPTALSQTPAARPVISIDRRGGSFVLNSPWVERDWSDESGPGTVCSALVDLATEFVRDNPTYIGLHCGAAAFDGRLVLFPSGTRSGKSTLIARLAAAGYRIFADDLLAVDPATRTGRAFGILPRLRRPIPRSTGEVLNRFVRARKGLSDRRQVYLRLEHDELAGFGETCPIGAIVLLERQEIGPTTLEPIDSGTVVQRLLLQNLIQTGAASALFDQVTALAASLPAYRLRYSDLDEAADSLTRMNWPAPAGLREEETPRDMQPIARTPKPKNEAAFVREPSAELRRIDGAAFLVSARTEGIYGLNTIAAGIWAMLEEPLREAEIVETVAAAFPDRAPPEVAQDVRKLLRGLLAEKLVIGPRLRES
jgi:hypothetical protein